ncbi:MAG: hypothetical protein ACOX68_04865 [Candidatus Limivicinus sp.]
MQGECKESPAGEKIQEIVNLVLKAVPLAMGVAVTVLTILNQLDIKSGMIMLGIGLAAAAVYLLQDKSK